MTCFSLPRLQYEQPGAEMVAMDGGRHRRPPSDTIGRNWTSAGGTLSGLKRPDLPDGGLKDLNDALHDLHRRAGRPSTRDLAKLIGVGVASKSRIYDAFSSDRLPSWGLLQVLAEALCASIPGTAFPAEEQKLHSFWLAATGGGEPPPHSSEPSQVRTASTSEIEAPTPVLAMRIEWARPSDMSVRNRRALRSIVTHALSDIGYTSEGPHRRDMSAGSVDSRHEDPALTTATFLAGLEDSLRHSGVPGGYQGSTLNFLAHLGSYSLPATPDGTAKAVAELDELWRHQQTQDLFSADEDVSALLADALLSLDRYDPLAWEWAYGKIPLLRTDRGPQDLGDYKVWVRTRASGTGGYTDSLVPF